MWWDAHLIESTVTRQFVCSHLAPEDVPQLDIPLSFGDGLTDGTYWEWIDEKAKRIFLILVDLGMASQIFKVIDNSWEDHDLPIHPDQVENLALVSPKSGKVDKKGFYTRQFHYLVRYIEKGDHVVYQDAEVVPVCVVDKRAGLSSNAAVDRVELPHRPGEVFSRRRIPLGTAPGSLSNDDLLIEINNIRNVQNDHIVSYFGSYTYQDFAYVLFTCPSDFNLKSLLTTMPGSVKSLPKQERRHKLMNWIHCLADTLCYLHNRGRAHGNIKPSTILFDSNNHIFYTNMSRLSAEALAASTSDKSSFDKEAYDFAAPELWHRPAPSHSTASHRKSTFTATSASSTSSDGTTFSINRGHGEPTSPSAVLHAPNPLLNPQAADIFSLGCVILELITLQMKRQTRSFAAHRAAKHKTPGRGGAVLDSSFHKNLGQVESWMAGLAKDAAKKDDQVFRGIAPTLQLAAWMLAVPPNERPTAQEVEQRMYKILTEDCGIAEPHCVHQYDTWDFGLSSLRLNINNNNNNRQGDNYSIATRVHSSGGVASRPTSTIAGHARSSSIQDRDFVTGAGGGLQVIQGIPVSKVRTS
ncbi:kinase-like domain-containing protein [Biscogniauxia sp. FL1348]|nr:kinase-like domain-containing protein [Biscogniauxia sp. FL1348]